MLKAALMAFSDVVSPQFRLILAKAIGLTGALFIFVIILVPLVVGLLAQLPWPWAENIAVIGSGLALVVAFFFLMSPVAAAFAGLFLDQVAEIVERHHYPDDPPGQALPLRSSLLFSGKFFLLMLAVNIAALPAVFIGLGVVALILANAYLLSREYFEMVARRHMSSESAAVLRRQNGPSVLLAGTVPALLSLVPIVNLAVPLFATSFFTHVFKSVRRFSA
jgi:CysZ protein